MSLNSLSVSNKSRFTGCVADWKILLIPVIDKIKITKLVIRIWTRLRVNKFKLIIYWNPSINL